MMELIIGVAWLGCMMDGVWKVQMDLRLQGWRGSDWIELNWIRSTGLDWDWIRRVGLITSSPLYSPPMTINRASRSALSSVLFCSLCIALPLAAINSGRGLIYWSDRSTAHVLACTFFYLRSISSLSSSHQQQRMIISKPYIKELVQCLLTTSWFTFQYA